ncbi:MAG: hypothetical protein U1E53_03805 [Dongiaceae bacterium]
MLVPLRSRGQFTAEDLDFLFRLWPQGRMLRRPRGDVFEAMIEGEAEPWLLICRRFDGSYYSCDTTGRVLAEGDSLEALELDGPGP